MADPVDLTPTEAAILGLLSRGERSGWDLQRGSDELGYGWKPPKSRIYAVLPMLVERGLLTAREVVQRERPNKTLYRVTRSGRRALRAWLAEPPQPELERNSLLLKVTLGELVGEDVVLAHIEEARVAADELKRRLERLERSGAVASPYEMVALRHGIEIARAQIRWATAAAETLRPSTRRR